MESPQLFNALFSFLSGLESSVLWMCTPDYGKQIYLSDSYEHVWERDKVSMFNMGPKIWQDTIVFEDVVRSKDNFYLRENPNTIIPLVYRLVCPNGKVKFIKDTSFSIPDKKGDLSFIMGIAEVIEENRFKEYFQNTNKLLEGSKNYLFNQCADILKNELNLVDYKRELKSAKSLPKQLHVDGQFIRLTPRQLETAYYLLKGYSAKHTARALDISHRTVEIYIDQLKEKLNCQTKISLMAKLNQAL